MKLQKRTAMASFVQAVIYVFHDPKGHTRKYTSGFKIRIFIVNFFNSILEEGYFAVFLCVIVS